MENNRICDVLVDHFIMKKETICHISAIWETDVIKLFTQSVRLKIQSQDFHGSHGNQTGTKQV